MSKTKRLIVCMTREQGIKFIILFSVCLSQLHIVFCVCLSVSLCLSLTLSVCLSLSPLVCFLSVSLCVWLSVSLSLQTVLFVIHIRKRVLFSYDTYFNLVRTLHFMSLTTDFCFQLKRTSGLKCSVVTPKQQVKIFLLLSFLM